jgi:hypothetical protein
LQKQHQQPAVLKNSFWQEQNMQVGSSTSNLQGGTSSAPLSDESFSFVNMVDSMKLKDNDVYLSTKTCDYGNLELTSKGKENFDP